MVLQNTGATPRKDPSTGGFSTLDVNIAHELFQELFDLSPCDSLSSDHRPLTITLNLPAEQLKGQKRLVLDRKKGNLPAFTNEVEDQIRQECDSRKMKVDKMYGRMSTVLLKAAQKHIGVKAVGMAGQCWLAKEINDKLKEQENVRRSEVNHTEANKSLNEEVSRLTTDVKRGIRQRKVLKAKGMSEMWRVLKSLTDNKSNNIISDNKPNNIISDNKPNNIISDNKPNNII